MRAGVPTSHSQPQPRTKAQPRTRMQRMQSQPRTRPRLRTEPQAGSPARPASPLPVVSLVLVAVAATAAGLAFHRVFAVADLLPAVGVAAGLPVLLVGLARRGGRPLPLLATTAAWMVGFVVWAACTVARDAGGLTGRLDVIGAGLVDGWARLLDVAVPAPTDPVLLVVPLAATWLAAAVGAEVAVRTRTAVLPAAPSLVVLVGASAAAVPAPGSNLASAAAVAVAMVESFDRNVRDR